MSKGIVNRLSIRVRLGVLTGIIVLLIFTKGLVSGMSILLSFLIVLIFLATITLIVLVAIAVQRSLRL